MKEVQQKMLKAVEGHISNMSPIIAQMAREEMEKLSKFPMSVKMNGNAAQISPITKNEKESEEAVDEATKGASPQFMTQFKFKNKSWVTRSLKMKMKDVKHGNL
jgi:hypothetical protein